MADALTGSATDDLAALIAAVREGRWLKSPREAKEALVFLAGFLLAKPDASVDEIDSALRLSGLGPLAWTTARTALERPVRRRLPIRSRLLGEGVA